MEKRVYKLEKVLAEFIMNEKWGNIANKMGTGSMKRLIEEFFPSGEK